MSMSMSISKSISMSISMTISISISISISVPLYISVPIYICVYIYVQRKTSRTCQVYFGQKSARYSIAIEQLECWKTTDNVFLFFPIRSLAIFCFMIQTTRIVATENKAPTKRKHTHTHTNAHTHKHTRTHLPTHGSTQLHRK